MPASTWVSPPQGPGRSYPKLNLPIKKLVGAKQIRIDGHKRATDYFPGVTTRGGDA
jgi:hypothetical protein